MTTDGVFVVGTDTGVGKTVVAGGVARALQRGGADVAACKPAESGGRDDAEFLADAADADVHEICPFFLDHPLAPKVAAETEGVGLDYSTVVAEVERRIGDAEFSVVEGVGGLRVPLTDDHGVSDLVVDLGLPALVVARPSLGTLNHTALTVEALRRRDVEIAGVVLSDFPEEPDLAERTNPDEISRVNDVVVVELDRLDDVSPEAAAEAVEASGVLDLVL